MTTMILDSDQLPELPAEIVTIRYWTHKGHFTVLLHKYLPQVTKEDWGKYLRILRDEMDTEEQIEQIRRWLNKAAFIALSWVNEADRQVDEQVIEPTADRKQQKLNNTLMKRHKAVKRFQHHLLARKDMFTEMFGG
jgi:hypothetical protein